MPSSVQLCSIEHSGKKKTLTNSYASMKKSRVEIIIIIVVVKSLS